MVHYIENSSGSTLYAIVVGTLIFSLNHNRFKLTCLKKSHKAQKIQKLVKMEDVQEALRIENGDMYITSINMHAVDGIHSSSLIHDSKWQTHMVLASTIIIVGHSIIITLINYNVHLYMK